MACLYMKILIESWQVMPAEFACSNCWKSESKNKRVLASV